LNHNNYCHNQGSHAADFIERLPLRYGIGRLSRPGGGDLCRLFGRTLLFGIPPASPVTGIVISRKKIN